MQNDFRMIKC